MRRLILIGEVWKDFMKRVSLNLVCPQDRQNFNLEINIFSEMSDI